MLKTTCALLLAALSCAAVASGCGPHTTIVRSSANEPVHGITVLGSGDAKSAPDVARVTLGIELRAEAVEQLTTLANQRMSAVIAALKQQGVADKDIRTQGFSIFYERESLPPPMPLAEVAPVEPAPPGKRPGAPGQPPVPPPPAPAPKGMYRITNMVEATVRDLDRLGQILKTSLDAGANSVYGVSFELEDPKPLIAQARVKAVENARKNAEELARLTGVRLGPVISVTDTGGGVPMPGVPAMAMMKESRAAADQVPIERGEITTSLQVQIVYALSDR